MRPDDTRVMYALAWALKGPHKGPFNRSPENTDLLLHAAHAFGYVSDDQWLTDMADAYERERLSPYAQPS